MTDIFYKMGREARRSDLRIPSYWLADLRFLPVEFYRGLIGKKSLTRQNMKKINALKKQEDYETERKFVSVTLAEEYHRNGNKLRYEAAESFASLSIFIGGTFYIAGNVIGPPVRFIKGVVDNVRGRKVINGIHDAAVQAVPLQAPVTENTDAPINASPTGRL